jgi:hypothetical protein
MPQVLVNQLLFTVEVAVVQLPLVVMVERQLVVMVLQ